MENRNGLVVDVDVRPAHGRAEREAALGRVANLPGDQRHRPTDDAAPGL
jgi:hypothetical protein